MLHRIGIRRLASLVFLILFVSAGLAGPAAATDSYMSRTTGIAVDAYWTQIDGTPVGSSPFGNVHIGWLTAYETSPGVGDAFAYIDDFDCEPGAEPDGGHGEEDGGCTYMGSRYGEGYGLSFTVERRLGSASLQGPLTMVSAGAHGGDGTVVGSPTVDMTWTATSSAARSTSTYRYNDGTTTYSERYRSTSRTASLDGVIGAMTFDPSASGGSVSSFSSASRSRTK